MNVLARLRAAFAAATPEGGDPRAFAAAVRPSGDAKFGDYQANGCMGLAKQLGVKNPRELAQRVAAAVDLSPLADAPEIAGPGFLNVRLRDDWLASTLAALFIDDQLGISAPASKKSVVIDYSSPNVAKPMHVGHLRSTVIGESLARIIAALGHDVVRDNHLGDWGAQFGMILWGWKNHRDDAAYAANPVRELARLYRLTSSKIQTGAAGVEDAARAETAKLHAGDEENRRLWAEFMPHCLSALHAMYERLGTRFDVELGESFYDPMLADVVAELEAKGLAVPSQGATVVFVEGLKAPMLVRKSDGAYNYATTDLATVKYRVERWHPDQILYVVDHRQSDHFKQLFAVAKAWGFTQVDLEHVAFGTILGADRKPYKTRAGDVVGLESLLDEGVAEALKVVQENSPDLTAAEQQSVAEAVGMGAIKYADLSQNRQSDYVFDWNKMLAMNGNTAAYLQYAYARVRSIFRKGDFTPEALRQSPPALVLSHPAERALALGLLRLPETLELAADELKPNVLTDYLFNLANTFSTFFEECPVLKAESPARRDSRLALCDLTARTLKFGLELLGIDVIERMQALTVTGAKRMNNFVTIPSAPLAAVLLFAALPSATLRAEGVEELDRSPVALALSADGARVLTANQTAGSVSLLDTAAGKVLDEVKTGDRPAGVAFSNDGRRAVVSHWYGYDLAILDVAPGALKVVGRVEVGPEPRGVVIADDGRTAFVAVGVANEVVRVDLDDRKVTGRVSVGREPRALALTPDGKRLVVSNARSRDVSVIAVNTWSVERTIDVDGDNLRQIAVASDGKFAYLANMKNRGFATTKNNIDKGWVLGQRLTRVTLEGDEPSPFATIALDRQGVAAADAHGAAVSRDGKFVAVGLGGSHEIMIFRLDQRRLPWRLNGSRDFIPPELLKPGDDRFHRVPLGGRPTELAFAPDGKALYVANYLANSVQVVDPETAKVVRAIPLGGPSAPSLARRGEIVFHDASKSFNQWYSCATCHTDGHTNGLDFDTMNDGRQDLSLEHLRSRKKVPTLRRVTLTAPWTWHGWQTGLEKAAYESFTKSMQGPRPADDDVKAVVAYLATLDFPRNPYREKDGRLSPAAQRGETVFKSSKVGCEKCHSGPEFTDGKIHNAGLEEPDDAYAGYNPPSLRGVYDKDPYLHDGRSKTLREALKGPHSVEALSGGLEELPDSDLDDLIAYLKSL